MSVQFALRAGERAPVWKLAALPLLIVGLVVFSPAALAGPGPGDGGPPDPGTDEPDFRTHAPNTIPYRVAGDSSSGDTEHESMEDSNIKDGGPPDEHHVPEPLEPASSDLPVGGFNLDDGGPPDEKTVPLLDGGPPDPN